MPDLTEYEANALSELYRTAKPVTVVYSGRHGCACGCRGNHSSTERSIRSIRSKIDRAIRERSYVSLEVVPNTFVSVETETRLWIAYTDGRVS